MLSATSLRFVPLFSLVDEGVEIFPLNEQFFFCVVLVFL